MKREQDRTLWLNEIHEFKVHVEKMCKRTVSTEDLRATIKIMNNKRHAIQRLTRLRAHNPAPISGKDGLLIEQIAFYDDPVRFTEKLNLLCDELVKRVQEEGGVSPKTAPRIMIAGAPMALPNWKVHNLVENAGAVVVNEESCIGTRYFKDLVDEDGPDMDSLLAALTDRYMRIDCSCFTPNDERVVQVMKEYKESNAQGLIHYSLQFCHTYNIEEVKIREAAAKEGIPYLAIETDYSPEDIGQLQTRIEALLEQVRG